MSIHDDIALHQNQRRWFLDEWLIFANLDADDEVINFEIIDKLVEDTETLLELFQQTEYGKAWLVWQGHEWARWIDELAPSLREWHKLRKYNGVDLEFIVEDLIENNPETYSYLERIKEYALELLAKSPEIVIYMLTWVSVLNENHTKFCSSLQERLLALDERLTFSTDWVYAAGEMFAEGEHLEVEGADDMTEPTGESDNDGEISKLHQRAKGTGSLV